LVDDAVRAEDVAGEARDVQRLAHVVALGERDLLRAHAPGVFQLPEAMGEELSFRDLRHHVDELLLHELKPGDRAIELHALLRVRAPAPVSRHCRSARTPDDAVPRPAPAAAPALQSHAAPPQRAARPPRATAPEPRPARAP